MNQMYSEESLKIALADLEKLFSIIPKNTSDYRIIENFKKAGYSERVSAKLCK
ncbi:hypothetical protein LEP1GSC056_1578 [Leptospira borgpetersenii str. Brem 328]|uniref:Uncharacterized protein n=1 Tax=Leptospira borgpetersenii str. Brem 328 TaxID=1049780 RepID=A0ABC9SK90_LEPBO|nr:hypothetical protein LEP1GSC056_1578 [Leptospira borgpetersenii str. Brem 328]